MRIKRTVQWDTEPSKGPIIVQKFKRDEIWRERRLLLVIMFRTHLIQHRGTPISLPKCVLLVCVYVFNALFCTTKWGSSFLLPFPPAASCSTKFRPVVLLPPNRAPRPAFGDSEEAVPL